jgi:hypothetical protein
MIVLVEVDTCLEKTLLPSYVGRFICIAKGTQAVVPPRLIWHYQSVTKS